MKNRDAIMAIFWIILGLTIAIWSATFPFGNLEDPGPAYFPAAMGVIIAAIGVLLLIQVIKRRDLNTRTPLEPHGSHRAAIRRVVFYLTGVTLSAVVLEALGFVLTMFFMILFMMRTIAPQRWTKALFYSSITALGSMFVFKVLLKTQLPSGFLGF